MTATDNKSEAYKDADKIIICTPTNYNINTGEFDTQTVETVINDIMLENQTASIFIRSTIPVGFTNRLRKNIKLIKLFFLRNFLEKEMLYMIIYIPPELS